MEDSMLDMVFEDQLSGYNAFFGPDDVEDYRDDIEEDVEGDPYGFDFEGQEDYEPSVYDGTYSEE